MPIYLYRHPKTDEVVEVVQGMNDLHEFIKDGVKYQRVFLTGQMSVDTQVSAWDRKGWMRKTAKKGMTAGEMMDMSADLSEKRAREAGKDPIKQKVFDNYRRKTGKPHPEDRPKKIETKDYVIEF